MKAFRKKKMSDTPTGVSKMIHPESFNDGLTCRYDVPNAL
jgi:hypothetical protein